jgi:hypothetical protein
VFVSFINVKKNKRKNLKNVNFIFYDVLVLFYKHCFSFNIFETVIEKYFKIKSDE